MKKACSIILLLLSMVVKAQVVFKTIVPQQPIVAGESFRVQYVAEHAETFEHFMPPSFSSFRLVTGPEVYDGGPALSSQSRLLKNTIYTLLTTRPGRYKIAGAMAKINGKFFRSNDAWIEVITPEQAEQQQRENGAVGDNSPYLRPGEDPYQKIRQNLFVKVLLNKKVCYTGEAVVATFKLYSRLESRSEIAKNPGFYGFTVHDMVGLTDRVMSTETVNGKSFDVHTIRQVQLYPLQAGMLIIDPMEINNKVEFARSYVGKKTEQEIVEGFSTPDNDAPAPGAEIYETSMRTEPVVINVKPAPAKNRPAEFNGATGQFELEASIQKKELARNEEGYLNIVVKGSGNFSQLSLPPVQWPAGIEGFDPVIIEAFDKNIAPIKGQKTFRFQFISSSPGSYSLAPIIFSFFNPDNNSYKTLSVTIGDVVIANREKERPSLAPVTKKRSINAVNRKASIIAASIVIGLVLIVLLYWILKRKEPEKVFIPVIEKAPVPSAAQALEPVREELQSEGKIFYSRLYHAIWAHLGQVFNLAGTSLSKQTLNVRLKEMGYGPREELMRIIEQCEAGMFTNAMLTDDREAMLLQLTDLLQQLKPGDHSAYL